MVYNEQNAVLTFWVTLYSSGPAGKSKFECPHPNRPFLRWRAQPLGVSVQIAVVKLQSCCMHLSAFEWLIESLPRSAV